MPTDRLHRDNLRTNVQVVDTASGESLGHLLDISLGGLGVAGSGTEPPAGDLTVRLRFPMKVRERREVVLPVRRRWLEHTGGKHWHAGFSILEVADTDIPVLEHLMTWYTDPD